MSWHPQRIGDAVREELGRFGPPGSMPELLAAWPAAVGPAIAANAVPARVARDGTLHVATSSSVWAFELTQLEDELLARLGEVLDGAPPPRLRFSVGRLPAPAHESVESSHREDLELTPEALAEGLRIAAPIESDELRETVARAAALSLARARADRRF